MGQKLMYDYAFDGDLDLLVSNMTGRKTQMSETVLAMLDGWRVLIRSLSKLLQP